MNKKILRLALPNIVSNITIPLLGFVDMALMGHLGDEKYIGAIALGGMIFNFIYWSFAFLRMGSSGLTAQAYGAENREKQMAVLMQGILVAVAGAFIIILMQGPVEWLSFKLIKGSAEVEELAASYFRIRVWAAPATLSIYALNGWFLGMQNARFPMIIAIAVNVMNILFNFIFVMGFNLESDGVAYGTVIAQYTGLIIAIILYFKKYRSLKAFIQRKMIFDPELLRRFFNVNSDIFLRTLLIIAVFTFFTSRSAADTDVVLAVNSILLQFLMLFSYFIDGFAFAGEALVGKYLGAKNAPKFKRVIKLLFIWGAGLSVLYSALYLGGSKFILSVLTNNQEIISASQPYLIWIILVPLFSMASYIWDGIYIGATASKGMLYSMLGAALLIFFPVYFLFEKTMGNHALWLAMVLFMGSRGLIQTFMAKWHIWNKLRFGTE